MFCREIGSRPLNLANNSDLVVFSRKREVFLRKIKKMDFPSERILKLMVPSESVP
jgi:hypothetical protein